VQFVFDETEPTSHFLESRLDGLAFDLIGSAKDAQSPGIQFAGHTDIIGTEKYNLDLSERRAKKELSILRLYLAHHLGFKNTPELEKWFADNNVTIGAAGYGQTKPYSLQAISADGVPVVIGDNNTPRGRTINRRVTVEHGIDEKQTPR
jgi:outer membrane protein OmpA-like peptidoglycan-associated protein